jgi:hypothetical protein
MQTNERLAFLNILGSIENKNTCIEIGSYAGGSLRSLSKTFNKVYSCDLTHTYLDKEKYDNVEWITGDSKITLPKLIEEINNRQEKIDFVLIDGSHEYDYVFSDINNILKYKPQSELIILIHDSFYIPSRKAICATKWNECPHIHFIDTDLCTGDLMFVVGKTQFMGGFCLVVMSPQKRVGDIIINQSQDYMYKTVNKAFGNII